VPEAENLFLTCKFWPILAQIDQIKTIQNPLELENVYCLKSNVTRGDIYNNMCNDVTYNYIIYYIIFKKSCDQNIPYMDKTYLI